MNYRLNSDAGRIQENFERKKIEWAEKASKGDLESAKQLALIEPRNSENWARLFYLAKRNNKMTVFTSYLGLGQVSLEQCPSRMPEDIFENIRNSIDVSGEEMIHWYGKIEDIVSRFEFLAEGIPKIRVIEGTISYVVKYSDGSEDTYVDEQDQHRDIIGVSRIGSWAMKQLAADAQITFE